MTTLTLKINERNKTGKAFLELIDFFKSKGKKVVEVVHEESPYNPEFVRKIKEAEKRENYTVIDTSDIWGSLGLK